MEQEYSFANGEGYSIASMGEGRFCIKDEREEVAMSRFKEKDLSEMLKEFDNKSMIEIKLENSLSGSILLKDATIKYDEKLGFINIEGKNTKLKIERATKTSP